MTPLPTPPDPTQTPQPPQAVSPTGAPLVSARLAPYFAAAAAVCAVVAGASKIPGLHLPDAVFGYATLLSIIFGVLLGTTPGMRKTLPMVLLVLGVGLSSCAHEQAILVTSDSIVAAGVTYEAVAAVMSSLHRSHGVTETQYASWYSFALRYKASFKTARLLYDSAAEGGDVSTQQTAANIIAGFIGELGTFEALIAQVAHPDGGAT